MENHWRKHFDKITFLNRLCFAIKGIKVVFLEESNFRIQCLCAVLAFGVLAFLKAEGIWWAFFSLSSGMVLSLEAINSATERLLDKFYPQFDLEIGLVKDSLAGAVLLASIASLIVFIAFIFSNLEKIRTAL